MAALGVGQIEVRDSEPGYFLARSRSPSAKAWLAASYQPVAGRVPEAHAGVAEVVEQQRGVEAAVADRHGVVGPPVSEWTAANRSGWKAPQPEAAGAAHAGAADRDAVAVDGVMPQASRMASITAISPMPT